MAANWPIWIVTAEAIDSGSSARRLYENLRRNVIQFFEACSHERAIRLVAIHSTALLLLTAYLSFPVFAQSRSTSTEKNLAATALNIGDEVEREIGVGEVHVYTFQARENDFATLLINQRGIDLIAKLFAPDGKEISETDSPNGTQGDERVAFIARKTGEYRLLIRPLHDRAPRGSYALKDVERRAVNRLDRISDLAARIAAAPTEQESDAILRAENELAGVDLVRAILVEGMRLRNTGISPARYLEISLRLLRYTDIPVMRSGAGMANRGVGLAYGGLGEFDSAEQHLLKTIAIFERFGAAKEGLARTRNDLATVYARRFEHQKAIEQLEQSRELWRELGNFEAVVRATNAIASQYLYLRSFSKVDEILDSNIRDAETLGNKAVKIGALQHAGAVYATQGRYARAMELFQDALRTAESSANLVLAVQNLYNIAKIQQMLGNTAEAEAYYSKVISLAPAAGDRSRKTNAMLNRASLYRSQSDLKKSVSSLEITLSFLDTEISLEKGEARRFLIADKAGVLNSLGEISLERGDSNAAMNFFRQSRLLFDENAFESVQAKRIFWELGPEYYFARKITALRNIATLYSSRGDHSAAAENFKKALEVAEISGYGQGHVETLISIAADFEKRGEYSRALDSATKALSIAEGGGRLDYILQLKTLLGRILNKLGRLSEANTTYSQAVTLSESLRTDPKASALRTIYFAGLASPYESYIDFLMQRHALQPTAGHDRAAFDLSERRRGRGLLDLLNEARADIRSGVDRDLIQQENEIRNRLNVVAGKEESFVEFSSSAEDSLASGEIVDLVADLQGIEKEIREKSPRYASLVHPQTLSSAQIQRDLLDEDTLLLEYSLGDARSYLWSVTQKSFSSHELPKREVIESAARKVTERFRSGEQGTTVGEIDPELASAVETLSEILLGPVKEQLAAKRLVIVADGELQYIPFSSLPLPGGKGETRPGAARYIPLAKTNEVVNLPSVSVLALLRKEAADRKPAEKGVAIVADPVFSDKDDRLKLAAARTPGQSSAASNSSVDQSLELNRIALKRAFHSNPEPDGTFSLRRLPFTRREAESIFANVPASTSFMALDFDASKDAVMGRDLSQFRIVHFATHGILHSVHPELSGIVLSLVNRNGEPINGFLRLNEIYNLNLNADLVVLSACQTALGKEVRGEGLIGLTRGFMYAGSPRVLASLWKVDDVATAELMKIFYQKMLKENMPPAAALRAAKIEMMKQKRWSSPYYWAAFELQGEWR